MKVAKIRYYLILFVAPVFGIMGCDDPSKGLSDVPFIELLDINTVKNASGKDTLLAITFHYEDGDGNIGLTDSDTLAPFNSGSEFQFNLWVDIFEVKGDSLKPILRPSGDTARFDRRIPLIEPTGKIKEISGEITVRYDSRPLILYPDTVKCRLTLIDRSLNRSNTITTRAIPLIH